MVVVLYQWVLLSQGQGFENWAGQFGGGQFGFPSNWGIGVNPGNQGWGSWGGLGVLGNQPWGLFGGLGVLGNQPWGPFGGLGVLGNQPWGGYGGLGVLGKDTEEAVPHGGRNKQYRIANLGV